MPALLPLVLVIKGFLLQRSLNDASKGGLGSYAIICMCISFLQVSFMCWFAHRFSCGVHPSLFVFSCTAQSKQTTAGIHQQTHRNWITWISTYRFLFLLWSRVSIRHVIHIDHRRKTPPKGVRILDQVPRWQPRTNIDTMSRRARLGFVSAPYTV